MSTKLLFKMAPGGSFPAQDHFDQRSQIIETFYGGWEGGGGGGRGEGRGSPDWVFYLYFCLSSNISCFLRNSGTFLAVIL